MEYVRLGRTGLKVSRICIGTNMFGTGYVDDKRAISVINEAHQQGINFIDTADVYHSGLSEQVVGRGVKGRRHDFVIATKGFRPMGPGVNDQGLSRKHLIEAVEGSLRRLDTDYIDLYYVHFWDPDTPLEETLTTLDNLVKQGKIRYLGCSNFAAWQLCLSLWVSDKHNLERFEAVQPEYNFSRREIESELFSLCENQRVGVMPFQLLMGGILTGNYKRSVGPPEDSHMASLHAARAKSNYWDDINFNRAAQLQSISAEMDCEPTQLVIAWALSNPVITSAIVGSSRPEQVVKNAEAVDLKLPAAILERIGTL